jgi:hypothetical protein
MIGLKASSASRCYSGQTYYRWVSLEHIIESASEFWPFGKEPCSDEIVVAQSLLRSAYRDLALHAAASNAQSFDVPEGFVAGPEDEPSARGEWRPVLTVRPAEGSFS